VFIVHTTIVAGWFGFGKFKIPQDHRSRYRVYRASVRNRWGG
jgi:hypothetical protein